MGLQLILCVESNKKTKSDFIYIKETMDYYYDFSTQNIKISPVYMNGKGKYNTSTVKKTIQNLIAQYKSTSSRNLSVVLYFFDLDKYDTSSTDAKFLSTVKDYCDRNSYQFVWFCRDIENVYLGHSIENGKKANESYNFRKRKIIRTIDSNSLSWTSNYSIGKSNILKILDQYLTRKTTID